MKCNGCGRAMGSLVLGGTLSYGDIGHPRLPEEATQKQVSADYHKTLCRRCQHVMKDILLSSDLSDHWHKYEWVALGDEYVEPYEDDA